jgi:hypothetical protein
MKQVIVISLVLAITSMRAFAITSTLPLENRLEFPSSKPVVLGEGWNVERQSGTKTVCVEFEEKSGNFVDLPGIKFSRSSDKQSSFIALSVSTSGELTLPIGKGATSLDFSYEQKSASDSIAVLIDGVATAAPKFVAPRLDANVGGGQVKLTKPAIDFLQAGMDVFVKNCGDSFVSVIEYGSRVIGQYEIKNASQSDRIKYDDSIKASSVSIGDAGASIQGKLAAELQSAKEEGRVSIFYKAYGSGDEAGTDELSFLKSLKELPAVARNYPRPLAMTITAYTSLGSWPESQLLLRSSPASNLTRAIVKLDGLLSAIRDIQLSSRYVKVFDTSPIKISSLEETIIVQRKLLFEALSGCEKSEACDDSAIEGFSDFTYRSMLPTETSLTTLSPGGDVNVLISNLAADRWRRWILDADGLRCKYNAPIDCLTENERSKWLEIIKNNIIKSLNP